MSGERLSTRILSGPIPRLVVEDAELEIVAGPDKGARLVLGIDDVIIGSSDDCDLVVQDPTVSSRHAEISLDQRGYTLTDLGSKNGLVVGDWPVERLPLAHGMRIRMGHTTVALRSLGSHTEVELGQPRRLGPLIAHSVKMRALAGQLEKLAHSDIPVLIEGETGTGKEVAAEALHQASTRADGPFVVFDCGVHGPQLIASALFGHERGAFTGADQRRAGAFEQAHGGTLFLDEIGELPIDQQPMLLRALERQSARRVGGSEIRFDVRVVSATHRNLAEDVRRSRFRQDLFYRLAGARVRVPPLRQRREDIPVLAHLFASNLGVDIGPELLSLLSAYDWPGNVRELRHVITRASINPDMAFAVPELDSAHIDVLPEARRLAQDRFEREYLDRVMAMAGGRVSKAAELAGVSRQMLSRLLSKHKRS